MTVSNLRPAAYILPAMSMAAPLAAPFIWQHSPVAALGTMVASHLAFSNASVRANCQWCGPVATRFIPEGDEVWLTIDDGPDPEDTPRLLDLLDGAGARATFFVRGDRAEALPELVRRGHGVGNHTYTHPHTVFGVCLHTAQLSKCIAAASCCAR
jgi:peptidoglycan/xylan/chitin deacetylase (PgdA/CDA1 family)